MKNFEQLTEEEQYLYEAIICARKIQEYLWGEYNGQWDLEEWKRMFKKRIVKIDDIDPANPHAKIELKKRVLQNTALGIALLNLIEKEGIQKTCKITSNLPQYSTENQNNDSNRILDGVIFRQEINDEVEMKGEAKARANEIVDDLEQVIYINKLKGECVYYISKCDVMKYAKEINDELDYRFTMRHKNFNIVKRTECDLSVTLYITW